MVRRRAGLAAGAVGTMVLGIIEPLERDWVGSQPPYHPSRIVQALYPRLTGRRSATAWGIALRWLYGPVLGVLYADARRRLPRRDLTAGVMFGATIWAFELLLLPLVGATPPVRRWTGRERAALLLHTCAFGVATALSLGLVQRIGGSSSTPRPLATRLTKL